MATAGGDGGWVNVSDAAARTRRSGATATLWRDTVIVIGGRNREADGCARAAALRGARLSLLGRVARSPLTARASRRRARSGEFFTEVLSFSLKERRWTSLGE